jgi:hypothetical protein
MSKYASGESGRGSIKLCSKGEYPPDIGSARSAVLRLSFSARP